MAKTRKTRKPIEEDTSMDTDEVTKKVVEEPAPPPAKFVPPVRKEPEEFTAILQEATTLSLAGRTFVKNHPTQVPMEHLKLFKEHGWFRVVIR